jgi:hypothetical protein
MGLENNLVSITVQAGADLSTKQYLFHVMAADGQIDPVGTQGIDADGVLQNKPSAAGQAATLGIYGVSNVVAGGAINPGAKVMSDNTGKAIAASSTGFALGKHIGLVAAASGDIVPVLLGSNGHFALS